MVKLIKYQTTIFMILHISFSLTLAINTPKIPANPDEEELLPVVVFYHGGGSDSIWGSAFTGLRMMEDKIVLITLNYR